MRIIKKCQRVYFYEVIRKRKKRFSFFFFFISTFFLLEAVSLRDWGRDQEASQREEIKNSSTSLTHQKSKHVFLSKRLDFEVRFQVYLFRRVKYYEMKWRRNFSSFFPRNTQKENNKKLLPLLIIIPLHIFL